MKISDSARIVLFEFKKDLESQVKPNANALQYIREIFDENTSEENIRFIFETLQKGYAEGNSNKILSPDEIYIYAAFFDYGIGGIPINKEKCFALYKQLAEQGHISATFNLGYLLAYGADGVQKDTIKGFELIEKAANSGVMNAEVELGLLYEVGIGTEKNLCKAVQCYKNAANKGFARAQCYLGICYDEGIGVEKDIELALEWYQKAVDQNNATACGRLGIKYLYANENNDLLKLDIKRAAELCEKAIILGRDFSKRDLGICYLYGGFNFKRDIPRGIQLLKERITKDDLDATLALAHFYQNDSFPEHYNLIKGFNLYEKATKHKNAVPDMETYLAVCYKVGRGTPKNIDKAVEIFKKHADLNRVAMNELADCYEKGLGVECDRKKAFELYQNSANKSNHDAIAKLAFIYKDNSGYEFINTDQSLAKFYFERAINTFSFRQNINMLTIVAEYYDQDSEDFKPRIADFKPREAYKLYQRALKAQFDADKQKISVITNLLNRLKSLNNYFNLEQTLLHNLPKCLPQYFAVVISEYGFESSKALESVDQDFVKEIATQKENFEEFLEVMALRSKI